MDQDRKHLYDNRTVARNIAKGLVPAAEVDAFEAEMEDSADMAEVATTRLIKHARVRPAMPAHFDDGE